MYTKEEQIKWLNALNNTCSLFSWYASDVIMKWWSPDMVKPIIEEFSNWVYSLNPKFESEESRELNWLFPYMELEERIKNANTKEELDSLADEVKSVEKESQTRVFWIYNEKKIKLK